jgi:hypothetical protein
MMPKATISIVLAALLALGLVGVEIAHAGLFDGLFSSPPSCTPRLTFFGPVCDPIPASRPALPQPTVSPPPRPILFPQPTVLPTLKPVPSPYICAYDPCANVVGPIKCLAPTKFVSCNDPLCNVGPCIKPHPTPKPKPIPSPSICLFDPCIKVVGPIQCLAPAWLVSCDDPRCNAGPCRSPGGLSTIPPFTGLQQIPPFQGTAGSSLVSGIGQRSCIPRQTPFGPLCDPFLSF